MLSEALKTNWEQVLLCVVEVPIEFNLPQVQDFQRGIDIDRVDDVSSFVSFKLDFWGFLLWLLKTWCRWQSWRINIQDLLDSLWVKAGITQMVVTWERLGMSQLFFRFLNYFWLKLLLFEEFANFFNSFECCLWWDIHGLDFSVVRGVSNVIQSFKTLIA